jgi:hypothetical protein
MAPFLCRKPRNFPACQEDLAGLLPAIASGVLETPADSNI